MQRKKRGGLKKESSVDSEEIVVKLPVRIVEFSSDGRYLALGSQAADKGTFGVWSADTLEPITPEIRLKHWLEVLVFDPTRPRILVSTHGGFRCYDLESGEQAFPEVIIDGVSMPFVITDDGNKIFRNERQWDASTGERLPDYLMPRESMYRIAFSPDGSRFVAGNPLEVWNSASGEANFRWGEFVLGRGFPDSGTFRVVDFSPDAIYVAGGSNGGAVAVLDPESRELAFPILFHTNDVLDLQFSPSGDRLATAGSDTTVNILAVPSGLPAVPPIPHESPVEDIEFNPDGSRLLTTTRDGIYRIWNGAGAQGNLERLLPDVSIVAEISSARGLAFSSNDGLTRFVKPDNFEPTGNEFEHDGEIVHIEMSPNETRLASVNKDGRTRVWALDDGTLEFAAKGIVDPYRLRFTADSKRLLLFYDVLFNLFDLETSQDLLVGESVHGWTNLPGVSDHGAAVLTAPNRFVIGATGNLSVRDGRTGLARLSRFGEGENYLF